MRARIEMPYQWPSGSRYCRATALSSTSDLIGWVTPERTASSMRPMSTVSRRSAGLFAPSVLIRCSSPELAEITLTLMPVSLVKASNIGWISARSRYVYTLTSPDWASAGAVSMIDAVAAYAMRESARGQDAVIDLLLDDDLTDDDFADFG